MKVLAIKKDRLEDLVKFGFEEDSYGSYTYTGKMACYECRIHVASWLPVLNVSEYDTNDSENSTLVNIPDIVVDLIEAGMVERYEY